MPRAKSQITGAMWSRAGLEFCDNPVRSQHASALQCDVPGYGRGAVRPGLSRVDDAFSTPEFSQQVTGAVLGRGQRTPGTGRADGCFIRPTSGRHSDGTPDFSQTVRPGAYLWWYVDAISDDGQYALSVIAFIGSVFSPYYARAFAKQGSAVLAENHCAINVALYGPRANRWCMTERGSGSVERDAKHLRIGPSQLQWADDHLRIDLNEISVPIPQRVRGVVRVYPTALCNYSVALDATHGNHRWGPLAPCARIEVELSEPAIRWQGDAYLDSNEGSEPVTVPFKAWDWSRARMADGSTSVIYDVTQIDNRNTLLAERFRPDGSWESFNVAPKRVPLSKTLWRIDRGIRCDESKPTQVINTLEDTPFYARSLLQTKLLGESVVAVHETIDLQRLKSRTVQLMLPWRMPRRP